MDYSSSERVDGICPSCDDICDIWLDPDGEWVNCPCGNQGYIDKEGGECSLGTSTDKIIAAMTEDEFHRIWQGAQRKFGYAGTYFGREDLISFDEDDDPVEPSGAEWEHVRESREWTRGLADVMASAGNEYIENVIFALVEEW